MVIALLSNAMDLVQAFPKYKSQNPYDRTR